ncbi:MAG: PAS domain S-box protein, partial [bacterium]|nr:PAS domain S-box protein [bacterium]
MNADPQSQTTPQDHNPVSVGKTSRRLLLLYLLVAFFGILLLSANVAAIRYVRSDWTLHLTLMLLGAATSIIALIGIRKEHSRMRRKIEESMEQRQRLLSDLGTLQTEFDSQLDAHCDDLELDQSDRQRIRYALHTEESRFRDLCDKLPVMIFETDADGRMTYVNQIALDSFGYTEADAAGGVVFTRLFAEADVARVSANVARIMRGQPRIGCSEYRARRKDGSEFDMTIDSALVLKDGRPVGLRGFAVDLTAKRAAEQERREQKEFLQQLVDMLPSGVTYKIPNGRFLLCNEAFCNFVGLPRDRVLGSVVGDFTDPATADNYESLDRQLLEGNDSCGDAIIPHDTPHGTRWFHCRKVLLRAADGTPRGIIGSYNDITEQRAAEETLRRSHELLQKVVGTAPLPIISV